jgi:hypothetical protein
MAYDYSSILADRETSENRLNAREHRFGIGSEEEHGSFLRALPEAAVTVVTSRRAERGDYSLEIEVGIDLVGQGRSIQVNRQALQPPAFAQHSVIRRLDELGTLGRTRCLEGLSYSAHGLVDIGEFQLDIRVADGPQLVELRASTGDAANPHLFEDFLKRILIAIASIDWLDMLVHASEHQVREIHESSGR